MNDDSEFSGRHVPLSEDLRALRQIMDEVLREQAGDELFQLVEQDGLTARRWREGEGGLDALAARVRGRPAPLARELLRAFTDWFQLSNVAEKVQRIRRRREYLQREGDRPQPGGIEEALSELKAGGLKLE